jgi:hypothetical protein
MNFGRALMTSNSFDRFIIRPSATRGHTTVAMLKQARPEIIACLIAPAPTDPIKADFVHSTSKKMPMRIGHETLTLSVTIL